MITSERMESRLSSDNHAPALQEGPLLNPALQIVECTASKIRTFLYELAEGTTNYRSLHSLTEQVEHQYHGRFIVELIQNAHDALEPPEGNSDSPARIEIALKDEGDFGVLYVANDGQPFSSSNFVSLSQLGQSDKDPQKSIGNKGIGFRSVLEITDTPEIYSRSTSTSVGFDGFCFTFSPEVVRCLEPPVLDLLGGSDAVASFLGELPLVDWDARLLAKFRSNVMQLAATARLTVGRWLAQEMSYLSPYLLPFPLPASDRNTAVAEYESRGFSTLIRLPLKSLAARDLVRGKLPDLDDSTLLFLDRVSSLVLDAGTHRRELTRGQVARPDTALNGHEVTIAAKWGCEARRYWVWKREIAMADAPSGVQAALQQLPGKWPQLQDVTVSIGVRVGEQPEPGTLSIFLPTLLATGCASHISAPFFGDMSRTDIDFGTGEEQGASAGAIYNRFLLSEAARLAISVINGEMAGFGLEEARAVVDLLAPYGTDRAATERWQQLMAATACEMGIDTTTADWFLSDRGWNRLNKASLLPVRAGLSVLTPTTLRRHAKFAAYVDGLDSRCELIKRLSEAHSIRAYPAENDLADTVESVALELNRQADADWNGFWADVDVLFDGECSVLAGRRVLLGNDDQLHASGNGSAVFFIPRQGASDDEDIENEGDVKEIPSTLRPFVAFLSERIRVYEERNGRLQQTRIRKLLVDSKLVSRFRREDILNDVLIARTPSLPVSMSSPSAPLCRDILLWGLRLMSHLVDRGKAERSLRFLRTLPAPCEGGWFPLAETAFGRGWPGTYGEVTERYLSRVDTPEARKARHRLLLPPDHDHWNKSGHTHRNLLQLAGVFDGLQLTKIEPKEWSSGFGAHKGNFLLPEYAPPGWSKQDWEEYRATARDEAHPAYNRGMYEVQRLNVLPGLDAYPNFDQETRLAFMNVVLTSAPRWEDGWENLSVHRVEGNWNSFTLPSPLVWKLQRLPWIGLSDSDEVSWCRPGDRWHIPALELARGRKWQFAHLRPLPGDLANRLDTQPRLAAVMRRLGMPLFDPETKTSSTLLLDALANAVERKEVPHWDVFLGQVRSAWRGFEPSTDSAFPIQLLVQRGGSHLDVVRPNKEHPIYLPDSNKSFLGALKHFELPVIAIETDDAKRLADRFTAAYPNAVLRASALQPVPLVNGVPWTISPSDRLRENELLKWVIPVLLTVAAFHGPRAQGTATRTFRRHVETFREARICIVGAIETGLFQSGSLIAPPSRAPALWQTEARTLLLADPATMDLASLSEAFASMLDREDLEVPIKLVLGHTQWQPSQADIVRALEQLKLSEGHYRDVREHWRGDVSQVIEMLVPLLTILRSDVDIGMLVELETNDAVIAFLDQLNDARIDGQSLVQKAQASTDIFDFGCKAFDHFGEIVQLSEWNAALALRDEPPLVNDEAARMFEVHLTTAMPMLRCLIALLVSRHPEVGTFRSLSSQIEVLVCPEEFATGLWQVGFHEALSRSIPLFEQWQATSEEIAALRQATTPEGLKDLLHAAGIDTDSDPLEAARGNKEQLRAMLLRLQRIGLAWAVTNHMPNPGDWESKADMHLADLSSVIEATAFTRNWNEQDIWLMIQHLPADPASGSFWEAVAQSTGLEDLIVQLGLSADDLNDASVRLEALREDARRRNRVIEVCGREFDNLEENLSGLWSHICGALPSEQLSELSPIDLQKATALNNVAGKPARASKTKQTSSKSAPRRLTKSMENLIGLSGEIHAFRMLQNLYGAAVVSASSWFSSNSTVVGLNELEKTDDGKGCDFVIALKDRTYYIEVKSSEGDQECFTLGSSEIRLAMALAKKSRRHRKETFVVLRVSNALTTTPSFHLLPNPYDPRYQSLFVIEEADARVRYRVSI